MSRRSATRATRGAWAYKVALASFALTPWSGAPIITVGLEEIESKVDRDGDVLIIEDILEGFGRVPVSVEFSPVSDHMFMGFKAGGVRIYPDGGSSEAAAVYDSCIDMEDEVRS